jgi:Domain of unknown function (DUF4333)
MSQPPNIYPPYGAGPTPPRYGAGPTPPPYGAGPQMPPPYGPPPLPPAPPPSSSVGKIIGIVVAVIVVLGGLGVGALLLFVKGGLDESKIEAEIVRITQEAAGVAPTDVTCPSGVKAEAGASFTCTATLDGQPVSFVVKQDDDRGNVKIQSRGFVAVDKIESVLAERTQKKVGVAVTADCADGRKFVVGGPGTTVECTVTNAADPGDTLDVTGTVTDDQGSVDFG